MIFSMYISCIQIFYTVILRRKMKKNVGWYTYFQDNRRYADIINGIAGQGQQIVSEKDLLDADSKTGSKVRDLLRKVALGVNFAIIGIENQEEVDYCLPARIMEYDVNQYKKQISQRRRNVRKNATGLTAGEYLYGFSKDTLLYPVVTFVLYAGEKPWDGPDSLLDIIDFADIPQAIKDLVQDYKVHIIDVRRLLDTSVFKTDVRMVFEFIKNAKDKRKLSEMADDDAYRNMEQDAVDIIDLYVNIRDEIPVEKYKREDGTMDMCQGLKEWGADCREEGREEERKCIVENMLKKGLGLEEICELTNYSKQFVGAISATIG